MILRKDQNVRHFFMPPRGRSDSVYISARIKQEFNPCVQASVRERKGNPLEIVVLWIVK